MYTDRKLMGIYLLHGDAKSVDSFRLHQRLDELLKNVDREANLNFHTFDLSESGTTFSEIISSALTIPFLGGRRVVLVRNLKVIEKFFKSKADENDEEADEDSSGKTEADMIIRAVGQLCNLPDEALLIMVEETDHIDKRSSFFRALKKVGCVDEEFKGMWFDPASGDISQVRDYIMRQATSLDIRLDHNSAEKFALLAGSDSGTINRELEKLAMYAGPGGNITEETIEEVVTPGYESGIFQLVDSIGYGNSTKAIEYLHDLLDRGAAAPYILTMIARQVRLIQKVRDAVRSGIPRSQGALTKSLGEPPFTIRKILTQERGFPKFEYVKILDLLMETDVHLKRGTMRPELALETLISRLATRFRN